MTEELQARVDAARGQLQRLQGNGGSRGSRKSQSQAVAAQYFSFDRGHENYHDYYSETEICTVGKSASCNMENVFQALLRNAAPTATPGVPATNGGVSELFLVGKVSHQVDARNYAVINHTLPGQHLLHPGSVLRMVVSTDSRIYVTTYGEGTGMLPDVNVSQAQGQWTSVDMVIKLMVASMGGGR